MEPTVSVIDVTDDHEGETKSCNNKKQHNSQESPKVETCCCCIGLKKGAKIIGFTQILINGIVFIIVSIVDFTTLKKDFERKSKTVKNITLNGSVSFEDNEEEGFCGAHSIELESLIMIAIAIRLLIGVFQNKPNLIEQWYHSTAELVLLSLILFITRAGIIYCISKSYRYLIVNFTELLYHGTMCYFTWVVYKYYLFITRKHTSHDISLTT